MIVNFSELEPAQRYFAMVQTIIPRPIAWVLTANAGDDNAAGSGYNLAPFSFFTGICSDPPLVLLSIGKKTAGDEAGQAKDTRKNILRDQRFVIHIAATAQLDALNASAATLAYGDSELDLTGLETEPFADFPLPRLRACEVALGCSLYRVDEIGSGPQAVVYGQIESLYVADRLVTPHPSRLVIDAAKVDPLARLGGSDYAGLGAVLNAARPK